MSTVTIHLFGGFQLTYNGASLPTIHQARQQSLLAYLLLHRHTPQARQHLAFLFWPDSSETQAHNNLRKVLYHLRQTIPEADRFLQITGTTVHWQPHASFVLDVAEFEQTLIEAAQAEQTGDLVNLRAALTHAADLYTGDLLPGCYEDWIMPERERLREAFLKAVARLSELLEQQRDYPAAIHATHRLLRSDPLHEESYHRLMRLHALNGDRAGALQVYQTGATVLKRELGIEPNPRLQDLYRQLLNLEQAPPPAQPIDPALRTTLVGRQPEWQQLLAAWQRASAGHAHCVFILGEAGIGKSRLAEELVRWVSHQGYLVARAHAYAAEGALIYAPVIEWLRSEALQPTQRQLAPLWLSELARLLPELLINGSEIPRPEPMVDRWQRQRLFEALARAVLAGAQPRLLMLDDLQWCDAETLAWLHYLLRFDARAPLLVVGTLRPEAVDAEHPATTLLVNLRQAGLVTEIELGPLSETETAALAAQVAERTLAQDVATHLYQASEGNPLFVVEMARMGDRCWTAPEQKTLSPAPALPAKVQAVLYARLAQLSPPARELVHLAATLGRAFPYRTLAQASGWEEERLVQALDELWQRRILREQGSHAYDFSHDRIREVAYQEINPARRRQLHRRVAQTLELLHAQDLSAVSAQLAAHYERAALFEPAAGYYYQAGERARQLYASQEAITYLQRGLDLVKLLPESADTRRLELDLQMALGAAWTPFKGFGSPEMAQAYDRAAALCAQMAATPQLFPVLWGVHQVYLYRTELDKALTSSEQCLQIARQTGDSGLLLEAYHALWGTHFFCGSLTTALAYAKHGLALYNGQQHQALALDYGAHDAGICALHIAATSLWLLGYPEQARQTIAELRRVTSQLTQPVTRADALVHTGMIYQCLHQIDDAQRYLQAALQLCNEHGYSVIQAHALVLHGWTLVQQGEIQAGLAQMQEGLADWQAAGQRLLQLYFHVLLAEGYALAGQIDQGLATLAAGQALAQQYDERFYRAELYRLQGDLLLAQGANPDAVESWYQQARELACARSEKLLELRATVGLARLWQRQGREQEAHQILTALYSGFTEGFDAADLQAANALLATLK